MTMLSHVLLIPLSSLEYLATSLIGTVMWQFPVIYIRCLSTVIQFQLFWNYHDIYLETADHMLSKVVKVPNDFFYWCSISKQVITN